MNDDEFSGIVRSGTSHSVSVSEHTGNAKTPKNIVTSHAEETLAKKLAFEEHEDADLFLDKIAQEIDSAHSVNPTAPHDDTNGPNVQDISSKGLDKNVQNIPADARKDNQQKLDDRGHDTRNRQTLETHPNQDANVQGVPIDTIDTNVQAIPTESLNDNHQKLDSPDGVAPNRQAIAGRDNTGSNVQGVPTDTLASNRQGIATDALAANVQEVPIDAVATNVQSIANDTTPANRAALGGDAKVNNTLALPHEDSANNTQQAPKLGATDNHQPIDKDGMPGVNRQGLAPSPALDANRQAIDAPAPELNRQAAPEDLPPPTNRQAVGNEHLKDHMEALPSTTVERAKADFSVPPASGKSTKPQAPAAGANRSGKAKPANAQIAAQHPVARTAAQMSEHEKFLEAFHGRLAGIKHEVDQINDRLDDFEHKQ